MFYIGVNSAVNPTRDGDPLTGTSIFAIICVYLFVVFYSFGNISPSLHLVAPADTAQDGALFLSSSRASAPRIMVSADPSV